MEFQAGRGPNWSSKGTPKAVCAPATGLAGDADRQPRIDKLVKLHPVGLSIAAKSR